MKFFLTVILIFITNFNSIIKANEIEPYKNDFENIFNIGKMLSHDGKFTLFFKSREKAILAKGENFNYITALYIGCFQILSLIPGVSRSGIIISGARFFNFSRVDSVKISFLLSIPTLTAVSLFNIQTLIVEKNLHSSGLNLLAVFLSFLFSYITIKFLIKFLRKFSLVSFVIYRIILGLIILFYSYL